jgi:hypothetical protein
MQNGERCFFCGRVTGLERHHVLGGVANRPLSEKYGLWVWLCHEHHTGKDGAQYVREKGDELKRAAQKRSCDEWKRRCVGPEDRDIAQDQEPRAEETVVIAEAALGVGIGAAAVRKAVHQVMIVACQNQHDRRAQRKAQR